MPKSEHERAEIRRKIEANRRSEKDRASHENARGKKLPSLSDLSRMKPTEEEISQLFDLMENESDRGSALVAGSFLETGLEMSIACLMVADIPIIESIFDGAMAPGKSFSAKIKLGLALGRYGPITADRLTIVKDIRNAFAHALRPLDFTHPTIVAACDKLYGPPFFSGNPSPEIGARAKYLAFCHVLFAPLYHQAQRDGDREITYSLP